MVPSGLYLILYTHLEGIGRLPGGRVLRVHVLFASRAAISFAMASRHCGFLTACENEVGSSLEVMAAR
jgi:hypothetical protein